ncbi:MAG: hypothetical protein JWN03_4991 [Nocardia sp.]|uniref:DUF4265 domain-containing protein n=1 Tax=Nocardia sp. TaxID=1821 RepID=UPI002626B78D|nr:DUF4265 domain-containing protein [Nocardia sp.]MCU1644716.1 hypothetical protein [Nocardia sp.]
MIDERVGRPVEQPGHVRVHFDLQVDDGWPPVGAESMWAIPSPEPDLVALDNIPWFVRGLAIGDVVRVSADSEGLLRMTELVAWSGNCTIRVIPFRSGPLEGNLQRVLDSFEPLGANGEGLQQFGIVALNAPPTADISGMKQLLQQGEAAEWWTYEEGCIGDTWEAAG